MKYYLADSSDSDEASHSTGMSVSGPKQQPFKMPPNEGEAIFRLPPYYYMHVLDLNTNVTRVEIGPKTYIRQDNER